MVTEHDRAADPTATADMTTSRRRAAIARRGLAALAAGLGLALLVAAPTAAAEPLDTLGDVASEVLPVVEAVESTVASTVAPIPTPALPAAPAGELLQAAEPLVSPAVEPVVATVADAVADGTSRVPPLGPEPSTPPEPDDGSELGTTRPSREEATLALAPTGAPVIPGPRPAAIGLLTPRSAPAPSTIDHGSPTLAIPAASLVLDAGAAVIGALLTVAAAAAAPFLRSCLDGLPLGPPGRLIAPPVPPG